MAHSRLALLGFGNVGRALARLLQRKQAELRDRLGIDYDVTGIYTEHHGAAIDPGGLDLDKALGLTEAGQALDPLSTTPVINSMDFIRQSTADVLFENSPVNHQTGQPAIDHLHLAL